MKAYGFIEVLCSLAAAGRHLSVINRSRVLLPRHIVSRRHIWKVLDPQCSYFPIRKVFGNRENDLEQREHCHPV